MFNESYDENEKNYEVNENLRDFPLTLFEASKVLKDYNTYTGLFDPNEINLMTPLELRQRREFLVEASNMMNDFDKAKQKVALGLLKGTAICVSGIVVLKLISSFDGSPESMTKILVSLSTMAAGYTLVRRKNIFNK